MMYPQYPYQQTPIYPPYFPEYPMMMPQKPSLLQSMKYSLNQASLSSTLRTAQKTLYTVNQMIPIINQLRPVLHNASTAFRVIRTVKQFDFDDIDEEIDHNLQEHQNFEHMMPQTKSST